VTPEEIQADRDRRRIERDREARRKERAKALPLPTEIEPTPEFQPLETERAASARESEEAYKAVAERMKPPDDMGQTMESERSRLEAERTAGQRSIEPGQERAETEVQSYLLPTFRPTRIRAVDPAARFAVSPAEAEPFELSDAQLDAAILASGEGTEQLKDLDLERRIRRREREEELRATPMEQVLARRAPAPGGPEGEVMYLDPDTGKLRQPTAFEEVVEAGAKQQIMSESAAKEASKRIKDAQSEFDRRVAKGEDVSWYEVAGPYFSGILSTPDETGAGTVETELGAALRSGLGTISALAAEGYFRGLGYEVDQNGVPKDPDDFGLAVANLRKQAGLPAVVAPLSAIGAAARRISPETGGTIERALLSIPQLAIPLPGVATEGTEREPTSKDPEGRRRVSGIEVPSVLEDPRGFFEAETRRIARNVASGRTFGDEFLDSPDTRAWYANVYGDEDAAFWGGSVSDVFMPAGPGTAARLGGAAAGAAAKSATAAKATGTLINVAEELRGAQSFLGQAAKGVVGTAADVAAAVVPGRASDGRVVRRVAEKVVDSMNVADALKLQAKAAIKPTSQTIDQVANDIKTVIRGPQFEYVYSTLLRNVPDDMVMVTDRVAVPRALASKWKARALQIKQEALLRPVADVRSELDTLSVLDPKYRAQLASLYKITDNAKGRVLSLNERTAFDKEWRKFASKNGLDPEDSTLLTTRRPQDVAPLDPSYANLTWSDIPAFGVERLLNRLVDKELLKAIPSEARLANDLTGAQIAIKDIGTGINKLLGDSMLSRRLRATVGGNKLGPLRQETVSTAAARQQIAAAAQTSIREDGQAILRLAEKKGDFDDALRSEAKRRLSNLGISADEAWIKALEAIYGNPEVAKAVRAGAFADAANLPGIVGKNAAGAAEFTDYPSVKALQAVDRLYARSGRFLTNNFSTDVFGGILLPNYRKALLKVFLEEGVRKRVAEVAKSADIYRGGVDFIADPRFNAAQAKAAAEAFADDLKLTTRDPAQARTELKAISPSEYAVRLYDPQASDVERKLAESGEELFTLAEGVEPRVRADLLETASQGYDWAIANLSKNMQNAAKYGYYLPNVPYILGKVFSLPLVMTITSGLSRTGQALDQVVNRMFRGGGLTLPDGRYLSPADLEYEARFHGIGLTDVESTRVGALADDLIRDGQRAAAKAKVSGRALRYTKALGIDLGNPFSRTIGERLAHSMELSFRRAVFESRLVAGDSLAEAAAAARRSVLDYSASPDWVRNLVGRYVADASVQFQMTVELLRYAKDAPGAARVFAKANSARAKNEDPYGIHGDRALKSLGVITAGDKAYYLPSIGRAYAPLEYGIAAARNGNQMLASMARAYQMDGDDIERALLGDITEGGLKLARSGINAALPVLSNAINASLDALGVDEKYKSNDVPDAKPMDDTAAFWAAAVLAHHNDLDRKSGDWNMFLRVFQPDFVLPSAEQAAYPNATDLRRRYWKVRPEGMPYLVWGVDTETNETIYAAMEPSEVGKLNMQVLRAVPGAGLAEALGQAQAAVVELHQGAGEPVEVRPEEAIPRLSREAPEQALGFVLGEAPTVESERRRQAAALAAERAAGGAKAE
jgi:hypothetical protein